MARRPSSAKNRPPASAPPSASGRPAVYAAAVLITVAALLAWHNSYSGAFVFDDLESIVGNPTIQSLTTVFDAPPKQGTTVAGRPLVNLSFALNHAFGGLDVRGYHVVNLALHIATGLTLFGLVRRTLLMPALRDRFSATSAHWLAAGIALCWTVHPLQTAAATYIAQRAEILGGLFLLLTVYCFVRAVTHPTALAGGPPLSKGEQKSSPLEGRADAMAPGGVWNAQHLWFTLAITACALGVASKETVAVAPIIALLYDRTFIAGTFAAAWHARRRVYAALAATWLLLALLVWQTGARGGTVGFGGEVTWWTYALKQCAAIVHYLQLAIWPHPLVFDFGTDVVRDWTAVWPQALLLVGLLGVTIFALVRRPVLGFAGAAFFLLLAPSSSVIPVATQTMAEHRMYLPLAALVALALIAIHRIAGKRQFLTAVTVVVVAAALVAVTIRRNDDYRTAETLWRDTVAKVPTNARAHRALAQELVAARRAHDALPHLDRALELNPDYVNALGTYGNALLQLGRVDAAIARFEAGVRLAPEDFMLRSNLGNALVAVRRFDEAIAQHRAAVELAPRSPLARQNLAISLSHARRFPEAIAELRELKQFAPDYLEGRVTLGNTLVLAGNVADAAAEFRSVLDADPRRIDVWCRLGFLHASQRQAADAVRCYEQALRLDPQNAEARAALQRLRGAAP